MSATTLGAARDWLASADTNPDHARRWWQHHPGETAMLPLGQLFDAIEVPRRHAERLDLSLLPGPIIATVPTGRLYVLVTPNTGADWTDGALQYVGAPHYLRVPDVSRVEPRGTYWLRPPDGSGRLTDPKLVRRALGGRS